MIRSFRHRRLARYWSDGDSSGIAPDLLNRLRRRLLVLDAATTLQGLNLPGFNFHPLQGNPKRYSVHINGPWCVTFEWIDGDAWRIDLENYH